MFLRCHMSEWRSTQARRVLVACPLYVLVLNPTTNSSPSNWKRSTT